MISEKNFKDVLQKIGFQIDKKCAEKNFPEYSCTMRVDFVKKRLILPETIRGRERNSSFADPENFVVFECVHRLLTKGYRPEHIELEKQWLLGHTTKSGRADICVYGPDGKMLFIIECKTAGGKFDKAIQSAYHD